MNISSIVNSCFCDQSDYNQHFSQMIAQNDIKNIEAMLEDPMAKQSSYLGRGITILIEAQSNSVWSLIECHQSTLLQSLSTIQSIFINSVTQINQKIGSLLFDLNTIQTLNRLFPLNEMNPTPLDQAQLSYLLFNLMKYNQAFSKIPAKIKELREMILNEESVSLFDEKMNKLLKLLRNCYPSIPHMMFSSVQDRLNWLDFLQEQIPIIEEIKNDFQQTTIKLSSKIPNWIKINNEYGLGHLLDYAISCRNSALINLFIEHPDIPYIMSDVTENEEIKSFGFFELLQQLIRYPAQTELPIKNARLYFAQRLMTKMHENSVFKDNQCFTYLALVKDVLSRDIELFKAMSSLNQIKEATKELTYVFLSHLDKKKYLQEQIAVYEPRIFNKQIQFKCLCIIYNNDDSLIEFNLKLHNPADSINVLNFPSELKKDYERIAKKEYKLIRLKQELNKLKNFLLIEERFYQENQTEIKFIFSLVKTSDFSNLLRDKYEHALKKNCIGGIHMPSFLISEELSSFRLDG
ncbi:MAG: hypothetical protein QRY72_02845 [Candidatus Rhabdochlamydia sp.]